MSDDSDTTVVHATGSWATEQCECSDDEEEAYTSWGFAAGLSRFEAEDLMMMAGQPPVLLAADCESGRPVMNGTGIYVLPTPKTTPGGPLVPVPEMCVPRDDIHEAPLPLQPARVAQQQERSWDADWPAMKRSCSTPGAFMPQPLGLRAEDASRNCALDSQGPPLVPKVEQSHNGAGGMDAGDGRGRDAAWVAGEGGPWGGDERAACDGGGQEGRLAGGSQMYRDSVHFGGPPAALVCMLCHGADPPSSGAGQDGVRTRKRRTLKRERAENRIGMWWRKVSRARPTLTAAAPSTHNRCRPLAR